MITSFSNPKIKFIKKLRQKKHRDEEQLFYVEGPRIVSEAYRTGWSVEQVFIAPDLISDSFTESFIKKLHEDHVECIEVDKGVFQSFSIKDGPKGIAAILQQRNYSIEEIQENPGLWVALDRVQDPGNLGSIFRTLDAVGGKGIVLIDNCVDPYDVSTIRGSMGSFFTMKNIKVSSKEFVNKVITPKIQVIGTSDKAAVDYQSIDYSQHIILLMGSEREGLSEILKNVCDNLVSIPMVGSNDSLNLAVATSVCLYEIFNQHRKKQ